MLILSVFLKRFNWGHFVQFWSSGGWKWPGIAQIDCFQPLSRKLITQFGVYIYLVSLENLLTFWPCLPNFGVFRFTCVLQDKAGTLGCVFIDNETHESGVNKCMTGEAWSAFSWHHFKLQISLQVYTVIGWVFKLMTFGLFWLYFRPLVAKHEISS